MALINSTKKTIVTVTVLPAHPHVHPQSEWAIPAFAFTAVAGTHLPTLEGWKAELAWLFGYVVWQCARRKSPIPLLTGLNVARASHTVAAAAAVVHCEAKNCNIFISSITLSNHVLFLYFCAKIPEWICNKTVTKLSTSPNECHYTTLWNITCVNLLITTVNASFKHHEKLTVTDKHTTRNVQSVCLWLWHVH